MLAEAHGLDPVLKPRIQCLLMLAEAHGLDPSNISAVARALDKKYNRRYHYLGHLYRESC